MRSVEGQVGRGRSRSKGLSGVPRWCTWLRPAAVMAAAAAAAAAAAVRAGSDALGRIAEVVGLEEDALHDRIIREVAEHLGEHLAHAADDNRTRRALGEGADARVDAADRHEGVDGRVIVLGDVATNQVVALPAARWRSGRRTRFGSEVGPAACGSEGGSEKRAECQRNLTCERPNALKPPASFGSALTRFANSSTDASMFLRKPAIVSRIWEPAVGMQVESGSGGVHAAVSGLRASGLRASAIRKPPVRSCSDAYRRRGARPQPW